MDDRILVQAAYAGRLWDAARVLDAEYTQDISKPAWADLGERLKLEFMHRTEHLIQPMLEAYAATGADDG
jgi:hypothetical protein